VRRLQDGIRAEAVPKFEIELVQEQFVVLVRLGIARQDQLSSFGGR